MPKIVGQDNSVYKRVTCKNCGSINEYLPQEVRVLYQGKDIDGGYSETLGFNCGSCNKEIFTRSY